MALGHSVKVDEKASFVTWARLRISRLRWQNGKKRAGWLLASITRILENKARGIRHVVEAEGNGECRKRIFPLLVIFLCHASHESQWYINARTELGQIERKKTNNTIARHRQTFSLHEMISRFDGWGNSPYSKFLHSIANVISNCRWCTFHQKDLFGRTPDWTSSHQCHLRREAVLTLSLTSMSGKFPMKITVLMNARIQLIVFLFQTCQLRQKKTKWANSSSITIG